MHICEFAAWAITMQTKCSGNAQNGQAVGGQEETGSFGEMQHVTQVWKEQEDCAGGIEGKGHSKGMDHISHMAKVREGQKIYL